MIVSLVLSMIVYKVAGWVQRYMVYYSKEKTYLHLFNHYNILSPYALCLSITLNHSAEAVGDCRISQADKQVREFIKQTTRTFLQRGHYTNT